MCPTKSINYRNIKIALPLKIQKLFSLLRPKFVTPSILPTHYSFANEWYMRILPSLPNAFYKFWNFFNFVKKLFELPEILLNFFHFAGLHWLICFQRPFAFWPDLSKLCSLSSPYAWIRFFQILFHNDFQQHNDRPHTTFQDVAKMPKPQVDTISNDFHLSSEHISTELFFLVIPKKIYHQNAVCSHFYSCVIISQFYT